MKKLLLVGASVLSPYYFNYRLKGVKSPDPLNFVEQCTRLGDFYDVKEVSLNAAGNNWTSGALINSLDYVDENTTVIVQWASIDRWDMPIPGNRSNEVLDFKGKEMLPDHLKRDEVFWTTHDFDAKETDQGYRTWITASMMLGQKAEYARKFFDFPTEGRKFLEYLVLAQQLLKNKRCRQLHFMPWNPFNYVERPLMKYIRETYTDETTYAPWQLPAPHLNLLGANPFLKKWVDLIDWSTVKENHVDYYVDRGLPMWCARQDHGLHQMALGNYLYIKSQLFPESKISLLDESIKVTREHMARNNIGYDFDLESVQKEIYTVERLA